MARHVITITELGEAVCWLLVQQALGMPDAKMQSDFMKDKVAMLIFTRKSLPERLCVTAAVRQMSGTTIFEGTEDGCMHKEIGEYQHHLLPIFGYYFDCLYLYGIPLELMNRANELNFPVINAGGTTAHPAHALSDIACMIRVARYIKDEKAAWIGCDNGTLYSLMAATVWFPFSLCISLPSHIDPRGLRQYAEDLNTNITFVDSPDEAVREARFIYAGRRDSATSKDEAQRWSITPALLSKARKGARVMLSASPLRAINIDPEILYSPASMLTRQAEYRLRVHKRILHWVFGTA